MSDMTNEAKVGDGPLCDQMQALQERARKLHPIDLHDPQLDTADPYTRLFLLAEYWQRQAKEARALRGQLGAASGWIVKALEVLDTVDPDDTDEAERLAALVKAGEVLALATLARSKTPNAPHNRATPEKD